MPSTPVHRLKGCLAKLAMPYSWTRAMEAYGSNANNQVLKTMLF